MKENTQASETVLWTKTPLDKETVKNFAGRYEISLLYASILLRRGIKEAQDLIFFLENSPVFLHNPFLFTEMAPAVERIFNAVDEQEIIAVFGDRDADGVCSTALFLEYFRSRKLDVLFAVPVKNEPYGLTTEKVLEFQRKGVTLIICVDNGSSSQEALQTAYENHIDVIIFDHHTVQSRPEYALCFINPHLEPAYPHKEISASVLALKALFALDFAQSAYFNSLICLISVKKDNNRLLVETNFVMNLLSRRKQSFLLEEGSADNERFLQTIQGYPLYTFHAAEPVKLLSEFFSADVYIHDLKDHLCGPLERLREATAETLESNSSIRRFYPDAGTADILLYLYQLTVIYNQEILPHYWQGFALAGIGLIADMMPMKDENRIIAKMCLKSLRNPKKSSLVTLFNHLNLLGQHINTKTVSWRIAPFINAGGRMGEADKVVEMLTCEQFSHQESLVQHINDLNEKRKALTESWFHKIYPLAQNSYQSSQGAYIFIYDPQLPTGLTGLLAGKFGQIFSGALILTVAHRSPEEICGSLRTNTDNILLPFLNTYKHLFNSCGGHQYAGGFSAPLGMLKQIETNLASFLAARIKETNSHPEEKTLTFDAELPVENFPIEVFELVDKLEPYGENFKPLTFFSKEIPIVKIRLIGKSEEHLRLDLKMGEHIYSALWWNQAAVAESIRVDDKIDLLYRIESGKNSGEKFFQIVCMRPSDCRS